MRMISVVHRTSERYKRSPGAVVGAVWSALPGALPELNAYPAERKLRLGRIYDCGMSPRSSSVVELPMTSLFTSNLRGSDTGGTRRLPVPFVRLIGRFPA